MINAKDSQNTFYILDKKNDIPIAFIHGVGLNHKIWEPQINVFENTFLAYDILGHGKTPTKREKLQNIAIKINGTQYGTLNITLIMKEWNLLQIHWSIGGDHSVTGGIVQSLAKKDSKLTKGKKITFLHFDAHTDCYEKLDHFLGAKKSAAHWASYLVKQGNVDPHTSTQIGIRGNPRTLDWLQASYDIGYQVITMDEYREWGHEKCIKMILDRLGDNPIYVTFDLDCLDPTVAPGVANIEPAYRGFNMDEARKLIQCLKGRNVIGGDVACLMPTKDSPNQITAMVAASIMFEIICLISVYRNKQF